MPRTPAPSPSRRCASVRDQSSSYFWSAAPPRRPPAPARRRRPGPARCRWPRPAGDEQVFRLLVDSGGADPRAATWQALTNAVQTNCLSCADVLLDAVRPAERDAALVAVGGLPYTALIQQLLERGANPNAKIMTMRRDLRGRTPLMVAANSDYLPTANIKMLLDRGADPNAVGPDGETSLDLAKRNGPTAVVVMLVAAGARAGKGYPRPALTPRPAISARAAVERAIPLLQRADVTFIQKTGCVACHHNVYAAMTFAAARSRGIPVDETMAREQVKVIAATLEGRREAALVGGEINDTAGNILMALAAANHPADLATDAMAYFLRMRQQADGRWRPLNIDHRPPINTGDIEVTAVAIRALRAYAPKPHRPRYQRAAERGTGGLREATPRTTDERAVQLLGLVWGGVKREDGNYARPRNNCSASSAPTAAGVSCRRSTATHLPPARRWSR